MLSQVHFNLMAIVRDRVVALEEEISQQQAVATSMADESSKMDAARRISQLQEDLEDQRSKRARWAFENSLRQHNCTGLAAQLLLEVAKGELSLLGKFSVYLSMYSWAT